MSLNINKEVDDIYYRYKMPKLLAKIEGKGNGIKTVIVNMSEIGKALYRKPSYPTKYFGIELGAQVNLDDKNDRYIINGCHDANKLQDLLHCFIKKFVLCQSCSNPETTLFVVKKSLLFYRCKACGFSDQIDCVHRLTQFIVKNPPETEAEGARVLNKHDDDKDNNKGSKISSISKINNDFDDTWLDEIDSEGKNNDFLLEKCKLNDDVGKISKETKRIIDFRDFVEDLFNKREIVARKKEIGRRAEELCLNHSFILVVMEIVFCNRDTVLRDIELYRVLFQYFTRRQQQQQQREHQKVQDCVLVGMEKIVVSLNIVGSACHFLKALYDNDIVEEEAIVKWYHRGPSGTNIDLELSRSIMKECSKMVEWLQDADEESDDDE